MSAALAIRQDLMSELPPLLQRVKGTAKIIALKIGTTPRAVESHRYQDSLPSLPVALAYARQYPAVRELLMRLMDAETGESGESPERLAHEIAQFLMNRKS